MPVHIPGLFTMFSKYCRQENPDLKEIPSKAKSKRQALNHSAYRRKYKTFLNIILTMSCFFKFLSLA